MNLEDESRKQLRAAATDLGKSFLFAMVIVILISLFL